MIKEILGKKVNSNKYDLNKKRIKLFYTCHSEPKVMMANKREVVGEAARILIKENNLRLIALHDNMAEELNEMFEVDNTVVVRNGIDIERFRKEAVSKSVIRKELGIPQNAFVVGHVGRFSYQKNHEFLIDVFEKVKIRNSDGYLLLVGAGELEDRILKKIEEKGLKKYVQVLKHRTDIHRIMRAMDIFIFPSLFEGLGIVAIEAQASGLPCIISDGVPQDTVITNQVIRLGLEAGAEVWADKILKPELPEQKQGDFLRYDMSNIVKQLEDLYR